MLGRILVTLGALLLIATAVMHGLGGQMVSGWVSGERAAVLQALWYLPAIDWVVVALAWLAIAWTGGIRLGWLIWLVAAIPAAAAILLVATVGAGFFGVWMLAGAVLLALLGSIALPRRPV
jgi:hypothetical protein